MVRVAFALAVLLAASPCAAADDPPPTHGLPPSTCAEPVWHGVPPSQFSDHLSEEHGFIIEMEANLDVMFACLRAARDMLDAEAVARHEAPNPVVGAAVDNAILSWQASLSSRKGYYNWFARDHNKGIFSKADLLPLFDLTHAPPRPAIAPPVLAAGTRLTMQSYGILTTHSCAGYYRVSSSAPTGKTLFSYDVAADGSVRNARVLQSSRSEELDASSLTCLANHWRNLPAIRDGVPVESTDYRTLISFGIR